jgi:hypothetical protein
MPLEASLVCLLTSDGQQPVGAGFLVSPRLVLTCAHVVNAALGLDRLQTGRPTGKVKLRSLKSYPQTELAAIADEDDAWRDPPASRELGADLCLLQLDNVPAGLVSAELGLFDNLAGLEFRTAGFPEEWDIDFASGKIEGYGEAELYLLRPRDAQLANVSVRNLSTWYRDQRRPPGIIHAGFSGGPVEVQGMIAGMLCEAKERISDATAYMLPVSVLPPRLVSRARRISASPAVLVRPAEAGSPNWPLVQKYLECIGCAPDPALEAHITRTVRKQQTNPL